MKSMASKVLADYLNEGYTADDFLKALDVVLTQNYPNKPDNEKQTVKSLFSIGLGNINKLFPRVGAKATSEDPTDYIERWVHRYFHARTNRPSKSKANPKGSANDPALPVIVKETKRYTSEQIQQAIKDHNLFMNAENIQGALLEEYINSCASKDGWIWAEGETMRACDFVRFNPITHIPELVQIKNRDNTENSSSSAIRQGTQIRKWNRLKTRHKAGKPYPEFQWDKLNEIMKLSSENLMSEKGYNSFLAKVAQDNTHLLD